MLDFVFSGLTTRVIFGDGTISQLASELTKLSVSRAFVLTTPEQAHLKIVAMGHSGQLIAGAFTKATMHTPIECTEEALAAFRTANSDGLVSVGGGSTTGLGKALALRTGKPHIVIPTTYAGSEMTDILGETSAGRKTTQRDEAIRPKTVIYDPTLTETLSIDLSVASGINAMAHAVEALYAPDGNPIISLMAKAGLEAFRKGLPGIVRGETHARSDALYGAWLCGSCLGAVSMALHHKVCHVIGGAFNLPHAGTHAVMLPYVTAYNSAAVPHAMLSIADALGVDDAASGLQAFARELGAPSSLKELGMPEAGVNSVVEQIFQSPYSNPQPLHREAIDTMIRQAWAGVTIPAKRA